MQSVSLKVSNNRAFDGESTKFGIVIVLAARFENLMRPKMVAPQCVFYRPEYCALGPNFKLFKIASYVHHLKALFMLIKISIRNIC